MGGGKKGGGTPNIPTERSWLADPIQHYRERTGLYPSNAQIWWAYRRPIELGTQEPPKGYLEVFDPSLRHQVNLGNTPSPRGHYILNALHMDRSRASGVPNIPVESSGAHRPSSVAFFAGRVFYAGVNTQGFNTKVYFSQILERVDQAGMCYQQQDPTSEDLRDLLPSDGGVIVIPDIVEVIHLFPMGNNLLVFASNGVWNITGSEGIGFRANDYSATKVSNVNAISNMSFVEVDGSPVWWNEAGIYTAIADQLGSVQIQSLTDATIKSFYDDIPNESKHYAKGAYNHIKGIVQWVYRKAEILEEEDKFSYDAILNLDTKTGAFYPFTPAESPQVTIKGMFDIDGDETEQIIELVQVGDDQVLVDDLVVLYLRELRRPVPSKFVYIVNVQPSDLHETIPTCYPDYVRLPDEVLVDDFRVYVQGVRVVIDMEA